MTFNIIFHYFSFQVGTKAPSCRLHNVLPVFIARSSENITALIAVREFFPHPHSSLSPSNFFLPFFLPFSLSSATVSIAGHFSSNFSDLRPLHQTQWLSNPPRPSHNHCRICLHGPPPSCASNVRKITAQNMLSRLSNFRRYC